MDKKLVTGLAIGVQETMGKIGTARSGIRSRFLGRVAIWAGAAALALGGLAGASSANAALVFDRGLPTENLNNAALDDRSNVMWADNETTSDSSTFWRPGDDFNLEESGAYIVNTIRVWSKNNTELRLLGGLEGGPIGLQSSTFTSTPVTTYDGGLGYQGNSEAYSPVYQIDFSVNIALNGEETFQFFLDGPASANPVANGGGYVNAFLHASNRDWSVSEQQGADDTFLWLSPEGNVETWASGSGEGTTGWGPGWDKDSDANVQVFATSVPEPETYAMMLAGLGVLGFMARRRKQKEVAAA